MPSASHSPSAATSSATHHSLTSAGPSRARFHGSNGATVIAANTGMHSGSTVALKNGAPTLSFSPPSRSVNSGYIVPVITTAHTEHSSTLFSTSAPSRDTGANSPPVASAGARSANSRSDPPITIASSPRMNTPRVGSLAKEWTELRMPDRTRNVPDKDSANVPIASNTVQTFSASRFSTTIALCSSAVPVSQGMSEPFSTGSQNQNPPHPRS